MYLDFVEERQIQNSLEFYSFINRQSPQTM